jgi:predicted permease
MRQLHADLRYAVRTLRHAPLLTGVAVASIALAIGANTAVFALVDQVLLRLLPARDARELVQFHLNGDFYGGRLGTNTVVSYPLYVDLRDGNRVFDGMFCHFPLNFTIGYDNRSERVNGALISGTYFPVLGIPAAVGRTIGTDDDVRPAGHPVAVLSHAFWRSRFASNPGIVGRTLLANGQPLTIIGVAREGFAGTDPGDPAQIFVPMAMHAQFAPRWLKQDERRFGWVMAFGRLRDGSTPEQAAAGLQPLLRAILEREVQDKAFARASPDARRRFLEIKPELLPAAHGRSGLRDYLERPLWILLAIVAGVLLIACANVANLLIARGMARQREVALRLALGASRRRVVQQLLIEGFVLAAAGGLVGLLLSTWGAAFLIDFYTDPENPLPISATPDLRVVAYTFGVVAATTLLCALAPAIAATRPELAPTLKEGAAHVVGGGRSTFRKLLVVAQVGVSLLLLIGAGLFLQTLGRLLSVDPGFTVDRVITFKLDFDASTHRGLDRSRFAKELMTKVTATPGVTSAGFSFFGLLHGGGWGMSVTVEGHEPRPDEPTGTRVNGVSPGFFEALRIRVIDGRAFTDQDERTAPFEGAWPYRVAIVNETFVKRYLRGRNPIGARVGFGRDPGTPTPIEIVGVVRNTKEWEIREDETPQIYVPAFENPGFGSMSVYARVSDDPGRMMAAMRRIVQQMDPAMPVFAVRPFGAQLKRSIANERLFASLSAAFGVLATLLAALGLYGVMAYAVTRRTREIGIRIALGARTADVTARILREAAWLVGIGLAVGLVSAWWLTRYVETLLFGVEPTDAATIVGCVLLLAAISTLAVLIPARRAARIDPIVALRIE